ncbi:MAG TPA: hypothetical protein VHH88_12260 [Verrucomicrobiae bacterium]|nr:hypothetical protein [Verrucomicrobiae bacterium]
MIQTRTETHAAESGSHAETVIGFAILGCLAAGVIGIVTALSMTTGLDVLLCLLGSVAAFGTVFYIYLHKG